MCSPPSRLPLDLEKKSRRPRTGTLTKSGGNGGKLCQTRRKLLPLSVSETSLLCIIPRALASLDGYGYGLQMT